MEVSQKEEHYRKFFVKHSLRKDKVPQKGGTTVLYTKRGTTVLYYNAIRMRVWYWVLKWTHPLSVLKAQRYVLNKQCQNIINMWSITQESDGFGYQKKKNHCRPQTFYSTTVAMTQ